MKKIDKKGVVKLIILIIFLITQIRAFNNSRANNIVDITAIVIDSSGLLTDENSTVIAINEGESGMAITLPDVLNTKKISKYFITQKEIIETYTETTQEEEVTQPETEEITTTEEALTDNEEAVSIEEVEPETGETSTTEEVVTEEENTTITGEVTTEERTTIVEMLPGQKIYLTQEEIDNLAITLTVEYDTKEVGSELFYNKKLTVKDEEDYEIISVSGYMPYDTEITLNEIDISTLENPSIYAYDKYICVFRKKTLEFYNKV